ncbi:glycosyltransferase [Alteromonas sp. RKMC-009]|uniref:glycosyltransferase n=1 Tax=Alteromonas sp. RKMC-009 TaxID=2267264 RepID=UPI000E686BC8|nr:glycosyltransferase [Alteromonas sp. RKMC-009]AYA63004.1 glycosyltransferase [Alteromonas sp. RKMC-009]
MSDSPSQELLALIDSEWYLNTYPDIAAAGIDPANHYKNYGWKEGRWPCAMETVKLDNRLWAVSEPEEVLQRLNKIASNHNNFEQSLATWFICRWHASWGNWGATKEYAEDLLLDENLKLFIRHDGPYLLAFSAYFHCGDIENARRVLEHKGWLPSDNKLLAASMLKKGAEKLAVINHLFKRHNLIPLTVNQSATLDSLTANSEQSAITLNYFSPLVSVLIPCYNAENTLATALNSLLSQTYSKIEIIVVDDASTDNSKAVIEKFVKQDSRIKFIPLPENGGAYAARNAGLKLSKGQLITVHDADDWSHPQKIEKQVEAIRCYRKVKAAVSYWARTDPSLHFETWRMEQGWIYRNVSSLMFRRSVFRKLGYWDNVSVNADTEYWLRIQKKYGPAAISEVMPGVPLAFGRVDKGSLTQTSATHLRTQYSGIRKDYNDAAIEWHNRARRLYMPQRAVRKFVAPPLICRGSLEIRKANLKKALKTKDLFDPDWYIDAYPDIAAASVDPLTHFINHGIDEGRDPNPYLSVSGLAYIKGKSNFEAISLWASEPVDKTKLFSVTGDAKKQSGKKVLMVAHLAGNELFGAERSFLDCIKMLYQQNADITVILPSGINHRYIREIADSVSKIYFTPLPWWRRGRREIVEVTGQISSIITASKTSVVYVNTLTLWEPHLAARQSGVKSLMHVRELPNHDTDLCSRLNATPEQIRQHIDECADLVIANSGVTASFVNLKEKTTIVYNAIDTRQFRRTQDKSATSTLNVIMLSSNTIKKGIDDFFKIAEFVAKKHQDITFFLYGPETEALTARLESYSQKNVAYCGYATNPVDAYQNMDVILNLSHFQESFGRTVVEGMACSCVPIAYNWGALEEIIDLSAGYLAPFGDYQYVADRIITLQKNKAGLAKIQRMVRDIAVTRYGQEAISKQYLTALGQVSAPY